MKTTLSASPRAHSKTLHLVGAVGLLAATIGCSPLPADDPGEVEEKPADLQLETGATKWSNGQVKMCWFCGNLPGCPDSMGRADFPKVSKEIRNQALSSWPSVAKVDFVGWDKCPSSGSENLVQILLNDSGGAGVPMLGQGRYSVFFGLGRSDVNGAMVPHELGHVLGFSHEMRRSDFQDDPTGACRESNANGDKLNTPADRNSIMASTGYCQSNPTLSLYDEVGVQTAYGRRVAGFRPLTTWWKTSLGDHATVSSDASVSSVKSSGYSSVFANGWVFSNQMPGTVPLKRYWHAGRGDFFSTATAAGQSSATTGGYTLQATEGFVFPDQQPGTVPLKLFWSSQRSDNLTTASAAGEQAALAAGYTFVRNEGFVFADRPFDMLWLFWDAGREDNLTTAQNSSLVTAADNAGYSYVGFDGAVLKYQAPGTVALKTFWNGQRGDHLMTATADGEASAVNAGYSFVRTEGFVYPSAQTGLVPMKSYWNGSRSDNFTTVSRSQSATSGGYTLTRTEGFAFPL
jgi:hypothetical protein